MSYTHQQNHSQQQRLQAAAYSSESSQDEAEQKSLAPPKLMIQASPLPPPNPDSIVQRSIFGALADTASDWVDSGTDLVRSASNTVASGVSTVGDAISSGVETVGDMADSGASMVGDAISHGSNVVGNFMQGGANRLSSGINAVGDLAADGARMMGAETVGNIIDHGAESVGDTVSSVGRTANQATRALGRGTRNMARTAGRVINQGSEFVVNTVETAGDLAASGVRTVGDFAASGAERLYDGTLGNGLEVARTLEAGVSGLFDEDQSLGMRIGGLVMSGMDAGLDLFGGGYDGLFGPHGEEMTSSQVDAEAGIDELLAHDMAYVTTPSSEQSRQLLQAGYDPTTFQHIPGSGSFSMVYIRPLPGSGRNPMIAFTGSDALEDFTGTNLDPSEVGHSQYYDNQAEIDRVFAELGDQVDVSGHSLGGALAQIAAANHTGQVARLTTFQAPGVNSNTRDQFVENVNDLRSQGLEGPEVNHHTVRNDIVSIAGENNLPGDLYHHEMGDIDSLSAHRAHIFGNEEAHDVERFDASNHPFAGRRFLAEGGRSLIGGARDFGMGMYDWMTE